MPVSTYESPKTNSFSNVPVAPFTVPAEVDKYIYIHIYTRQNCEKRLSTHHKKEVTKLMIFLSP